MGGGSVACCLDSRGWVRYVVWWRVVATRYGATVALTIQWIHIPRLFVKITMIAMHCLFSTCSQYIIITTLTITIIIIIIIDNWWLFVRDWYNRTHIIIYYRTNARFQCCQNGKMSLQRVLGCTKNSRSSLLNCYKNTVEF